MNTDIRRLLSTRLFQGTTLTALLLFPVISRAQSNTAYGTNALLANTTGINNAAFGVQALYSNTTGYGNVANGFRALMFNTSGISNTAIGTASLRNNTTGSYNTAIGLTALFSNVTGDNNVATGYQALFSNTVGYGNVANGYNALASNTIGIQNTAIGTGSQVSASTANFNTSYGCFSLNQVVSGNHNIALGYEAGTNITGSNNIDIGNVGLAGENGAIRIGMQQQATFIAGINGQTIGEGVAVYINANGRLGTITSSRRFKNDIQDMGSLSDKLLQLRPVTFRYKDSAEKGAHPLQYGLIAEEVAKVCPNLVQYDKQGKPYTVYYHLLTPMLLNAFQKEHRQSVGQQAAITQLSRQITAQKTDLAAVKTAHCSEVAALKAALQAQITELAALKESQQQQLTMLAKLASAVQTTHNKTTTQKVAFSQH